MPKTYIGTSGWTYKHWREVFYPKGLSQRQWLEHFAQTFRTVELNATFYRLPRAETFDGWRERTPEDFVFSVKCDRRITHFRKLEDVDEIWREFWSHISRLKEKLSIVLFQFPPRWKKDLDRLADFLPTLPKGLRTAFEFRDASWFADDTYALLKRHEAALCIASSPDKTSPEVITSDYMYIRMHGGTSKYASKYTDEELADWAKTVRRFLRKKLDLYVYFNNDAHGYAVDNARRLEEMVGRK